MLGGNNTHNRGVHPMRFALAFVLCALSLSTTAQTPLTIMSFNVRYGSADDGDNHWNLRKDTVVNAIKSAAPDIIGMQECLDFQGNYVANALPEYAHFGVGREVNGGGERMEILFREELLAPIETGHFWLSETPNVPGSRSWNSANVRMVSWAKFYHRKDRVFFYYANTHFDHRSEDARAHAGIMLADWAKKTMANGPLIITGDFNSAAEDSSAWTTLTGVMQDAWLATTNRVGPVVTWSAFSAPKEGETRRIDWVLLSPGIQSTRCETMIYNENGRYPSDHYPVSAQIVLPALKTP